MPSIRDGRPTDSELADVERRQRLADWSALAVLASLLLAAACALALGAGGPTDIFIPAIAVALIVWFVGTPVWVLGEIRATRAIDRLDPEPRPKQPLWKYVLSYGLGLAAGAAYWFASDDLRGWLWKAYFVAGCAVFVMVQPRRHRSRARRRRSLRTNG